MKKKWSVFTVLLCVTMLTGACASKNKPENDTKQDIAVEEPEVKEYQSSLDIIQPQAYSNVEGLNLEKGSYLSLIGKSADGQYWNAIKKGAEQAVTDMNDMLGYEGKNKIKVTYSGPAGADDVDEQVNILDEELARYPVALGISIVDTKACEVQFDLAAESDIPVIAFDSGSDYQGLLSMVATDNSTTARAAADRLVEAMGHAGEIIVFVQDSKSKSAMERESGFTDQIVTQHPGVNIVNVYHMDQLAQIRQQVADEINAGTYSKDAAAPSGQPLEEAQKVAADSVSEEEVADYIFAKHPKVKGCYGTSAKAVMLAVNSIKKIKGEEVALVGYDADEEEIKALSSGEIDGLIAQNPFGMGYAAIVASARASLELGNEAVVNTGYTWVTKKNMKDEAIQKLLY